MVALILVTFVDLFVRAFGVLLILMMIMSFVASPTNRFYGWLVNVTDPLLAPVRAVLPRSPGIDFSPMVVFIALQLLQRAVHAGFGM